MPDDEKIERWKPRHDWSADEVFRYAKTGEWPENPEYVKARRDALIAAGLADEGEGDADPEAPEDLESLSAEQLYQRAGRREP